MPANSFARTPIYVLDAVRTPVGSPFKSLKNFSAVQLGATVISGLMSRQKFTRDQIDEVVFGNTVMAGVGQNPARQSALLAGLSAKTPAHTVNHVCGAGLQAIVLASQSIALGHSQAVIAGGMESATRTPQLFSKLLDTPFSEREPVDSLIFDGLWCAISAKHMGEICENMARVEKISRASQDQYAFESHQKARAASQAKKFSAEIVPVSLENGDAYDRDERLRSVTLENLKSLPPAFVVKGTITAGSASVPSDGAAAVLLAGESFLRQNKISPLGKIIAYASIAVEPLETFKATVPAAQQCLKSCGLKVSDIDLFEIDEAFAAQAIFAREHLRIPAEKMNIYGGDIALGHPLGAAGARILVTLLHSLKTENKKRGLAVICLGGGGAVAIIVERIK